MQDKASVTLSFKDATKLLEGLSKDPQLRADNDPSVLIEEQYPSEHHAMLQGKTTGSSSDNIITILQWEKRHTPHLSEEQKTMLTEQKNKTVKLFQFTATSSNPWDEVQFTFWKHKVTNMVLSAIRLALKEDTSSDVNKLLFATGDHNNVTVTSGDKRNLAGLLICHPLLLNSPFEEPPQMDDLLDDLLTERHPHTVSQSNGNYGEYEADKAYIKLSTLKKAAILSLRNIYKVASHTFHVYLLDLLQGARTSDSHVFTRVKENRNQYLLESRLADAQGMRLKPHSAKDTLDFLKKHFVKESSDQQIIKWMDILRHTRAPGVGLYEWCNSFSPLVRAFLRISQDDDLGSAEQLRVNKCISAQITDFEQSVLVQANDTWRPVTLADGDFDLDQLKKDISTADAKFAGRKYKPTALITEYLISRASKQNVPAPSFVTEKSPSSNKKRSSADITKRPMKRFTPRKQRPVFHTEHESWEDQEDHPQQEEDWEEDPDETDDSTCWDSFAFQQKSTFPHCTTQFCKDRKIDHTHSTDRCYKLHPTKGKGSPGKGSHSLLFTKGSKGKGKGHGKGKGKPTKGKGKRSKGGKGKQAKGGGRSLEDTCHFCKQPGHYKAQCPKFAALTSKTGYERIRAKLPNEKVYVYDMLEDSVGMDVCGNCLCCECDWETCTPPVESLLFHEASRSFVDDGMWDMVSKAKSSNPPLSKEIFLQTHGQEDDCWEDEDCQDGDQQEEEDSTEESN